MPKLHINQASIKQAATSGVVDVSAGAAGVDRARATQALGRSVSRLGNVIEQKVERDAHLQNQKEIATARADWMQRMQQAEQNAQPGAQNFTENFQKEYRTWMDNRVSDDRHTYNSRKNMEIALIEMQNQFLQRASAFEIKESARHNVEIVRGVFDDNTNVVRADPSFIDSALEQNRQTVESLNLSPVAKSQLLQEQAQQTYHAAINGQLDVTIFNKDKEGVMAILEELEKSSTWKKELSDTQYAAALNRARQAYGQLRSENKQMTETWFKDAIPEIRRGIALDQVKDLEQRIVEDIDDPVKQEKMLTDLKKSTTTGLYYNQVKAASWEDIPKIQAAMEAEIKTKGDFRDDVERSRIIHNEAIKQRTDAIKADRAGYAIEVSDIVRKDWENIEQLMSADQEQDSEALVFSINEYANSAIAEQKRLGVPEHMAYLLPAGYVQSQKQLFDSFIGVENGPEQAHANLVSMADMWGKQWPKVKQQLIAEKAITGSQAIAAELTDPRDQMVGQHLLTATDLGTKELKKIVNDETVASDVQSQLGSALSELRGTMMNQIGGPQYSVQMQSALYDLSLFYVSRGDDVSSAVEKATKPFIDKYEFHETYRVPVQEDPDAVSQGTSRVMRSLDSMVDNIAMPQSLIQGLPEDVVKSDVVRTLKESGIWVTNGDETGLMLAWPDGTAVIVNENVTTEGRKGIKDLVKKGSVSTELTITVTNPRLNEGRPTNIPSIYKGKIVSEKEAIDIIVNNKGVDPETGRKLPSFDSISEAEAYAQQRSKNIQFKRRPLQFTWEELRNMQATDVEETINRAKIIGPLGAP